MIENALSARWSRARIVLSVLATCTVVPGCTSSGEEESEARRDPLGECAGVYAGGAAGSLGAAVALGNANCTTDTLPPSPATGSSNRAPTQGAIGCPEGYSALAVGKAGGKVCGDGATLDESGHLLGPFTKKMVEKCDAWGGGEECDGERWAKAVALSARGVGACPIGASLDPVTTYCAEGDTALGPFPAALVAKCIDRSRSEPRWLDVDCRSARWNRVFLAELQWSR